MACCCCCCCCCCFLVQTPQCLFGSWRSFCPQMLKLPNKLTTVCQSGVRLHHHLSWSWWSDTVCMTQRAPNCERWVWSTDSHAARQLEVTARACCGILSILCIRHLGGLWRINGRTWLTACQADSGACGPPPAPPEQLASQQDVSGCTVLGCDTSLLQRIISHDHFECDYPTETDCF